MALLPTTAAVTQLRTPLPKVPTPSALRIYRIGRSADMAGLRSPGIFTRSKAAKIGL